MDGNKEKSQKGTMKQRETNGKYRKEQTDS